MGSHNLWSSQASVKMNAEQFSKYLDHLDHPKQLGLVPDVSSLYFVYREHMTRFPYNNLDLYLGKPICDLSLDALLNDVPAKGGHCYQHSELMFGALKHLGFDVTRVAATVLMGNAYQDGMPLNHNILMVKIKGETFMCDPGLASASPRFPLKLDMGKSEEVTISDGDHYKLEVGSDHYNFYWQLKGDWFLLFRFGRDPATGLAAVSDRETTLRLCREVYEVKAFIPIRDKYVKVSRQTNDSKIDFFFTEGQYSLKVFYKGQPKENKTGLDHKTFFELLNKMCNLNLEPMEIPSK